MPPALPSASANGASDEAHNGHVAHHIHEFGEVEDLIHLDIVESATDDEPPVPPSRSDKIAWSERFSKLKGRMFHERHLMQYFDGETLYRTPGVRSVGAEELFLDLVIVGGLAALGHELRENFDGWPDVEKFILLFHAMYSSWKAVVFLWNLWDVKSDLTDKFGIYIVFTFLTGIALGAHGAFEDEVRPYVAVSSFMATAVPTMSSLYWSSREPLLRNKHNIINQVALTSLVTIITVLPYLAAAFVPSERATRILFWIPLVVQSMANYITMKVYRFVHRNRKDYTRLALSIEHFVEKYEVLTMIVLGESVLGLLFEAALVVTADGARVGDLYASAIAATAMLYSFQTLYVNVDSAITKGDKHAIRYKGTHGIIWSNLHSVYHFALILFATGLGLAIRDVTVPPSDASGAAEALRLLVRVGDEGSSSEAGAGLFTRDTRWLFSVGWGGSLIVSGLISALHYAGPRSATKHYRLAVRFVIAVAIMVGMPFTDLSAGRFLAVYSAVLSALALTEFTLVQTDRMGFFRSEHTLFSSTDEGGKSFGNNNDGESDDDSPEMTEREDTEVSRPAEEVLAGGDVQNELKRALMERLHKRHCTRLVAVRERRSRKCGMKDAKESEDV